MVLVVRVQLVTKESQMSVQYATRHQNVLSSVSQITKFNKKRSTDSANNDVIDYSECHRCVYSMKTFHTTDTRAVLLQSQKYK